MWVAMASLLLSLSLAAALSGAELEKARDAQDRATLDRIAGQLVSAAQQKTSDAAAQYNAAVAQSYVAEVAIEVRDKEKGRAAAETGIKLAERAVALKSDGSEYHRILGTLCGQVISAASLAGLKWGHCALNEVNRALELDPKSAINYVSRGVGNYYLPSAFGGGIDLAIKDFQRAIELDPKSADAYLWLGIAQRKAGHNAEAHKALQKSVELNPARVWSKQQLEKTPAQ
jgi:tetratricopeptide (TPR) repeat protein